MPLTPQSLEVIRGDAVQIDIDIDDGAGALDLTGASVSFIVDMLEKPADTSTQVLTVTGAITNAVGGLASFTLTSGNTSLASRVYYWAVRVTYNGDTSYTVAVGTLGVVEEVG
ncbi:MAG: hypothetical protein AAF205_00060 [Pseudomonadota bacterium]